MYFFLKTYFSGLTENYLVNDFYLVMMLATLLLIYEY